MNELEPVATQWRSRVKGGEWDAWENGRYGLAVPPFMEVEERQLVTLSSAQSALDAANARIAELVEENANLLLSAKMSADVASNAIDDMKAAEARATKAEDLLKEAVKVLEPFVTAFNKAHTKYAARYGDAVEIGFERFNTMPDSWPMDNITFSMGDFRAARSLCERIKGERKVEDKP